MATTTDATEILNRIPYPNDSYSDVQNAVLAIVPKISGFLSFVSSCAIILDNLLTRSKNKRINTQRRLLIGLSLFDMIQSACHICSTWPVPKFASEIYSFVKYNIGNQTSCTIQGFCLLFSGLTVPLYNAFLCLYYLICVKYPRMPPTRMSHYIEPFFHISAITYPMCLAIYGLLNEMYNATGTTCFVVSYPKRCKIESYGVDCIRGRDADNLRKFITFTIGVCFIMITLSLSSLYYSVKKQEKRMATYATHLYSRRDSVVETLNRRNSNTNNDKKRRFSSLRSSMRKSLTSSMISSRSHVGDPSNQPMRQTKRVFRQALFYVIPFLIVWVPTLLQIIAANLTESPIVAYIMILLCSICAPLQGFFNAIIYYKKRLIKRFSSRTNAPAIQDEIEENDDEPYNHPQNTSTDFDVEDLQEENNIFINENDMNNGIHLEFEEQDDIHVTQINREAGLDIESEDHLDNEIGTDKEETYSNLDEDEDEKNNNSDIMATYIKNDVYLNENDNKNNYNNSMEKDIHLEFEEQDDIHVTQINKEAGLDIESEDHLDNEIGTGKEETYSNLDEDEKNNNSDIMATYIKNDVYLNENDNKNNYYNCMEKDIHLEFEEQDDIHVTQINREAGLDIESEDHLDNEIGTDKEETYNHVDEGEKKKNTDIMATYIKNDVCLNEENNKNNYNNSMEKDIHLDVDAEN